MKTRSVILILVLVGCGSAAADAQGTGSGRPFKALFSGADTATAAGHVLDASISVGGTSETIEVPIETRPGGPAVEAAGDDVFATLSPELRYRWKKGRSALSATARTETRYYRELQQLVASSRFASVDFADQISRRFSLSVSQAVSYQGANLFAIVPDAVGTPASDIGAGNASIGDQKVSTYNTAGAINYAIGSRSAISLLGGYHRFTSWAAEPDRAMFTTYRAGGRYETKVSRDSSLHLGYIYETTTYDQMMGGRPSILHGIDAGVDVHRRLSFSRRTRVDFGVGSKVIQSPYALSGPAAAAINTEGRFRIIGNGGIEHDIGRSWRARVGYDRRVGFLDGIAQPLLTDAYRASVDGFASRRVDVHVEGSLGSGGLAGRSPRTGEMRTVAASARARWALNAACAMFAEYVQYDYNLGAGIDPAFETPRSVARRAARVGISVNARLLSR